VRSGGPGSAGQRNRSGSGQVGRRHTKAKRPWWQRPKKRPLPPTQRQQLFITWNMRILAIVLAFVCGPFVFWAPFGMRAFLAVAISAILFMLLVRSPKQGVVFSFIYLSLLGGLRRWLIPALGWSETDPLLLVGPTLVLLYFANLMLSRRIYRDTAVARLLLWLLLFMFVEIFNPLQGGIGVGLEGIIFSIVPVLWYYYGRDIMSERVQLALFGTCVGIGVLAALYGLNQTWFGFLPSEVEWVKLTHNNNLAIYISDAVFKAFSFFTSPQEYTQCCSVAVVLLWAAFLRGIRPALIPIPLLAFAIFMGGSRGPVVFTIATCTVLWAVQGKSLTFWAPRLILAGAIAAAGLVLSLTQAQENKHELKTQTILDHQAKGILNPLDSKTSTAGVHGNMFVQGLLSGFTTPVGRGLGSTSLAATKSGTEVASTEVDISDNFVALGFAGGLIYLAIVVVVMGMAVRHWRETRTLASLCLLGVLVINVGQWQHGGLYSISALCWLCIGALDQSEKTRIAALTGSMATLERAAL
jgi:hypothetical protein